MELKCCKNKPIISCTEISMLATFIDLKYPPGASKHILTLLCHPSSTATSGKVQLWSQVPGPESVNSLDFAKFKRELLVFQAPDAREPTHKLESSLSVPDVCSTEVTHNNVSQGEHWSNMALNLA